MAHTPFVHKDPKASDEALAKEAEDYLGRTAALQVMVELTTTLRELDLPWWSPEKRRAALSATDRMRALAHRPDIRQRIMVALCGLPPKAARRMDGDSQSKLIDEVLEEDRPVHEFEEAYKPEELVVYGNPALQFYQFMDAMPFDKDTDAHKQLVAKIIESFLNDKREVDKKKLQPVLTYWDVRTSIEYDVWQECIPRELRVAVDKARLELEKTKSREPFTAKAEIEIVGVANIAKHLSLKHIVPILEAAAKKMGFERPAAPKAEDSTLDLESDEDNPSPK